MTAPHGLGFREPQKRAPETLFLERRVNGHGEYLKALIGLPKDKDANDGSATNSDGNIPLLDYACIVFEHRCRRLANSLDVAFECRADACRYEWDIGLGRGTKEDWIHVSVPSLQR